MSVVNQVANNYHGHRVHRDWLQLPALPLLLMGNTSKRSQELKHVFYDETFAQNDFVHHCLRATSKEDINVLTQ
jgi:hypothetical protein